MEQPPRPVGSAAVPAADFFANYPRCLLMLERAVRETVDHAWDEYSRTRARDIARAMSQGCKICGFRQSSETLRSLQKLLSLSFDDAFQILPALREELEELLGLLKQQARALPA